MATWEGWLGARGYDTRYRGIWASLLPWCFPGENGYVTRFDNLTAILLIWILYQWSTLEFISLLVMANYGILNKLLVPQLFRILLLGSVVSNLGFSYNIVVSKFWWSCIWNWCFVSKRTCLLPRNFALRFLLNADLSSSLHSLHDEFFSLLIQLSLCMEIRKI